MDFQSAEAAGWAPYEALGNLSDDDLERPLADAHGWAGRDLIAHIVFWQEVGAQIVRDLATSDVSPTKERVDAQWDEGGDAWNERILADWREMPLSEVRSRLATAPAALRAALDAAPASRWWDSARNREALVEETVDHYADHREDLLAVLEAARR